MDGLGSEPVRLLSKLTEKVKQTQHRDSEELDHSEPSSYQQKHLIPCYRKKPFRDKTRKRRSDHRQGLKIRSSNVLSQPEFVGCSVLTALSLCIKDFTLTPRLHIFMGYYQRSMAWVYLCAGWPRERQFGRQLNTTLWSNDTNLERNIWTRFLSTQ
ncbi:hypothetical protein ACHWQZ_G005580 [Mnemiopsis leidyi]